MGEPTESEELFFDQTINRIETLARTAEFVATALGEGDFDAALNEMRGACGIGVRVKGQTVWETLTDDVKKLRDISDRIEKED